MNFLKGRIEGGAFQAEGGDGAAAAGGPQRLRRPAGGLRRAAGAFPARSRRRAGQGAGGRADRLGDAGHGGVRRRLGDLRVPRARVGQAGRDDPHHARPVRWCICSMPAPDSGCLDGTLRHGSAGRICDGPSTSGHEGLGQTTGNGGNQRMAITRRDSLALGAAALGAASIPIIGAQARQSTTCRPRT